MIPFLALALLAVACQRFGRHVLALVFRRRPPAVPALMAGLVLFHLLLLGLQLAGLPWTRTSVLLILGLSFLAAAVAARRVPAAEQARPSEPHDGLGWGDAVAGVALAGLTAAAVTLSSVNPDFVYHWGIKAKRFALAGGIDFAYLAHPWNHYTHPDYPHLLTGLYTATTLVAGRFDEPALLAWTAVVFAALLWSARQGLHLVRSRFVRQAGLAVLALGVAAFGIGYLQPGGADLLIALALLAAVRPLAGPTAPGPDLTVAACAAFAAASKIEGVPLAAILLAVYGGKLWRDRRLAPGTAARVVLPTLLVVAPWLWLNLRYDLFQPTNAGLPDWSRVAPVARALAESFAKPEWHGLSWLVLTAPLLLLSRPVRLSALVVLLQGGFYAYVYLSAPLDPDILVLASAPRLLLHLVPAVLLAWLVVLGRAADRPPGSEGRI